MNKNTARLPLELSALVHHIELHRAGWWDKTLNRLVLSAIWNSPGKQDVKKIRAVLQTTFGLSISSDKLTKILSELEAEDCLVQITDGIFSISNVAKINLEREIFAAEEVERKAHEFFDLLARNSCLDLEANALWCNFESQLLAPLIKEIGANTYHLIAGERMVVGGSHAEHFMGMFEQKYRAALKDLIASFLDPQNESVRSFVTRRLHAQFCIESSGVTEEILNKLKVTTGKSIKFRLFVDTNFLFSLLGLHENPSNASAQELKELVAILHGDPQVNLYVTPKTIDEAKRAISAAKNQVSEIPVSNNFTGTALRVGMSGMSEMFFAERRKRKGALSPGDWFDPYLNDFVSLSRAAGVELFNEKLDFYETRQDVVDDILSIKKYEEKLPFERRKSYAKIEHDVILWHLVKDKRPAYAESPVDVTDWILTIDFRFIGFDQHKLKTNGSNIPICIHPAALTQLLQFWVPRTQVFEEAVLGGLRLPFLFQEFDTEAERLSLKIIKRLGRFQGCDEIPEDTLVQVVMNDGLRSRMDAGQPEDEEIQLIRDALVDEIRMQAEKEKERVNALRDALRETNTALNESQNNNEAKANEIAVLLKKLAAEEARAKSSEESLTRFSYKQSQLESILENMEEKRLCQRALTIYIALLLVVTGISVSAGCFVGHISIDLSRVFGFWGVSVVSGVCVFIFAHLLLELILSKQQRLRRLWPFRKVVRFRKWLWGTCVVALLIGIAGSQIFDNIQNGRNQPPPPEQTIQSGITIPPVSSDKGD